MRLILFFLLLSFGVSAQNFPVHDSLELLQGIKGERILRWQTYYHKYQNQNKPLEAIQLNLLFQVIRDELGIACDTLYGSYDTTSQNLNLIFCEDTIQIFIPATGGGGGGCGCCDSLFFYTNDDTASVAGLNRGDYYFLEYDNTYGNAWGLVKMLVEPVPFTGGFPPGCLANVPDEPLNFYESDTEAVANGLVLGEYYLFDSDNLYGSPKGLIKKITNP